MGRREGNGEAEIILLYLLHGVDACSVKVLLFDLGRSLQKNQDSTCSSVGQIINSLEEASGVRGDPKSGEEKGRVLVQKPGL